MIPNLPVTAHDQAAPLAAGGTVAGRLPDFPTTASLRGKKVILVIPPSPFLLDERVFVSLGILRVAGALEAQGVTVGVLDLSGVDNYLDVVKGHFVGCDADWVGITSTTPQLPSAVQIARKVREVTPSTRLVLGGPHVTLTYSALKIERAKPTGIEGRAARAAAVLEGIFDVLVSGDGEFASALLCDEDCPKVIDADDNKGPLFMSNAQYEAMPPPARHLVDLGSYHYTVEGIRATSLIAQLGCPFHCVYVRATLYGQKSNCKTNREIGRNREEFFNK